MVLLGELVLSPYVDHCLCNWQQFIDNTPRLVTVPACPLRASSMSPALRVRCSTRPPPRSNSHRSVRVLPPGSRKLPAVQQQEQLQQPQRLLQHRQPLLEPLPCLQQHHNKTRRLRHRQQLNRSPRLQRSRPDRHKEPQRIMRRNLDLAVCLPSAQSSKGGVWVFSFRNTTHTFPLDCSSSS